MNRNWIRRLATLSVGLVCALAFSTMNLGCACKNGPCGQGCSKPCCKKCPAGCTKPCCKKSEAKKEEPKKEEPKKEEPKKP